MEKRKLESGEKGWIIAVVSVLAVAVLVVWGIKTNWGQPAPAQSPAADSPAANETAEKEDLFALDTVEFDLNRYRASGLPVIVVFGTDTCLSCLFQYEALEELQEMVEQKAVLKYVNLTRQPEADNGFRVVVVPTLFFYDQHGNPYAPQDPDAMDMIVYRDAKTNAITATAHEGYLEQEELLSLLKELGMT